MCMETLMAEWTGLIWASPHAQRVWEPRLRSIQQCWSRVEVESVERGLRPCGLVFGNPMTKLPTVEVAENRFAFGLQASKLAAAYATNNNQTVGHLLGY